MMNRLQKTDIPRSVATRLITLGLSHASGGREAEAVHAFQRAVSVEPNAADAWFCLGVVYCGRQMAPESIAAHRQAALAQPENADYWYALGTMYQTFQPRRWRRAASAAFREALTCQAIYPEAQAALDAVRDASAIRRVLRRGSRGWRRSRHGQRVGNIRVVIDK